MGSRLCLIARTWAAKCSGGLPAMLQARKDAGCTKYYLGVSSDCTYSVGGGVIPAQFFAAADPIAAIKWRVAPA